MAKIGILGGSFHPFHNGHLLLGQYCLDQGLVDEIWFIPTGVSYLKAGQKMLSGEERLRLVQLAIEGHPHMKALDIEVKRPGNTYTCETLEELCRLYPEDQLYFIIGADCLFTMETWYHAEQIFATCHILAARRDGISKKAMMAKKRDLEKKFRAKIHLIDFEEMEISSTDVRSRIRDGRSIEDLVPKVLATEIQDKGYFRE